MYISRLEKAADYLESIATPEKNDLGYDTFLHLHEGYAFTYGVLYHKWVLMYLSDIFPEFYLDEIGYVCYNLGGKGVDGITGVYITFGLSLPEEFFAILEAEGNQSSDQYDTKTLGRHSTAKDIAFNLRKIADFKRNKLFKQ